MIYPSSVRIPLNRRIKELTKNKWFQKPKFFPTAAIFQDLTDIAFHASLQTEEKRRPGFRLIYVCQEDLVEYEKFRYLGGGSRIVTFPSPRKFSISELNRIAPAADLTRFLVCVSPVEKNSETLHIWGLLDVGENWFRFVHHETSGGMPPPNYLTITSTSPGELSFSLQGNNLIVLRDGKLSHPSNNPIWDGPVSDFFEAARDTLYTDVVHELKSKVWDEKGHDDDYPQRFFNFFVERLLFNVRQLGHGGTLIFVPQGISFDDSRLTDRITFKYATQYNYAWKALTSSLVAYRKYYDLYFELSDSQDEISNEKFKQFQQIEKSRDDIREEIQDIAKCLASLTGVDGAVVLTTGFELLGFGGEITADSPTLKTVSIASSQNDSVAIDSFGTRHRSAFRFCSSFEDSVAFILSSDGGVKAAKRDGPQLLFWPDINEGAMGL